MARTTSRFGWIPQQPDHRDRIYNLESRILKDGDPQLPAAHDLWPNVPPIWNQEQLGACVAHGSLRAFLTEAIRQGLSLPMLSRLWVYAKGRDLEGTPLTQDSGMQVRDAIKVLSTLGAPPESDWPYSDANPGPFDQEPPASLDAAASQDLAITYQSIVVGGPGAPMRTAVASGLAIVFGFSVPSTFQDGSWNPATQVLPLPQPSVNFVGGHCVVITGYDFSCKQFPEPYFICDNSWDTTWGGSWGGQGCTGGRFAMAWDWFDVNRGLATDLWVVQKVS
jgi:C1A family cysteine protease